MLTKEQKKAYNFRYYRTKPIKQGRCRYCGWKGKLALRGTLEGPICLNCKEYTKAAFFDPKAQDFLERLLEEA